MTDDPRFAAFAGASVLVAGGLGFIGSTLAGRLVGLGAEVLIVDNLYPDYGGNRFNIAGFADRVTVVEADIRDEGRLADWVAGRRFVFNLAAQTSHLESLRHPLVDLDINARAPLALIEACRAASPGVSIVYGSTRQMYGRPERLPVREDHPLRPVDVNGVSKLAGEAFHTLYAELYGMRTVSLRLTNTYGPRMRIKDNRQNFVGIWLRSALEDRAFEVWNGAQRRDLTYVDDAVDAVLLAALLPEPKGRAFNIGGHGPVSLRQLADALVTANGGGRYELREFPEERKRIDIGDYWSDDAAFRAASGWRPKIDLAEGLGRSLDYFRGHLEHYL